MCLLRSRWWIIAFRGPKTPILGAWIDIQAKYAKNSNSYIFRSVCQIDMKFDRLLRPATKTLWVVSYGGKTIPRWRTAAILKKTLYSHISAKNHPISMKFCNCTQQQILNWMNVTWSKMKKLHWTDSMFDRTFNLFLNKPVLTEIWFAYVCVVRDTTIKNATYWLESRNPFPSVDLCVRLTWRVSAVELWVNGERFAEPIYTTWKASIVKNSANIFANVFFQAGVYGGVKNWDFRPISHFISQPVEAMAIVTTYNRRQKTSFYCPRMQCR